MIPFPLQAGQAGMTAGGGPYRSRLRFDTGDASTVFTDEGLSPKTWTRSGTGVFCSTTQILEGVSSLYCTANTDYLEALNDGANAVKAGDFTINIMARWGASPVSAYILSVQNAGATPAGTAWAMATNINARISVVLCDGTTRSVYTASANAMSSATNYTLRWVRSGTGTNNNTVYINSTNVLQFTDNKIVNIPSGEVIRIGAAKAGNTIADTYFDNFWTARKAIPP